MTGNRKVAAAIVGSVVLASCGPPRVSLPTGTGTPVPDYLPAYTHARTSCEAVRTFQAELGLSGRAAGHRVRGRVHAGLIPDALRLEGVAPFGAPVFILVADGPRGTLLLPRDRRVLQDAPPEDILEALVGIKLGPEDLRSVLTGCVKAAAQPVSALGFGADWMAVDLASGGTIYLRRRQNDWQIVAGRYGGLEIDYTAFDGARPSQIALRGKNLDLRLALGQVALNVDLPRTDLVAVNVPPGTSPLTLDELRRDGPLGQ